MPVYLLEESKSLYRTVVESGVRGHTRMVLIAACVYVSCLRCDVARSLKEITCIFGVSSKALIKACRSVTEQTTEGCDNDQKMSTPHDYVGRFCSKLNMCPVDVKKVRKVIDFVDEYSLVCNAMPPTIAAGAILMIGKIGNIISLTAEDVGKVSMLSPVTISKMAKRLLSHHLNTPFTLD